MRLSHYGVLLGAAAVLFGAAITSSAQRTPPIAPGVHPMPRTGGMQGHALPGSGQIIGNKKTRVYHLPGDRGNLPAAGNRVYFRTERDAMAAGYHAAGSAKKSKTGMHHNLPNTMNHNVRPMPGGPSGTQGGNTTGAGGHLPK